MDAVWNEVAKVRSSGFETRARDLRGAHRQDVLTERY